MSRRTTETDTKHARALAYYCAGLTYREIAVEMRTSVSHAHYMVHAECRRQGVRLVRVRRFELRPLFAPLNAPSLSPIGDDEPEAPEAAVTTETTEGGTAA